MLSENIKIRQVMAPVADFANGDTDTAVFGVADYRKVSFVVMIGVNAGAGDLEIVPKVCSVNAKTNAQAVGYYIRQGTGSASDTIAAPVRYEAGAGLNIATANCVATQHVVEVDVEEARKVWRDAGYTGTLGLYCTLNETQGDAMVGAVLAIGSEPRFSGAAMPTTVIA